MKKRRVFVVSVAVLVFSGCSPRFDSAAESQKLLARDAEWAAAATEGKDVEKIISYWSDDAVVYPPGQPVAEGKAAIRAFVAASLKIPGFKVRWASEKPAFSPDGKMATLQGANEMTMTGPDGAAVSVKGRGATVWRLEPDGQWRCVIDIWNDVPPAAPAAAK